MSYRFAKLLLVTLISGVGLGALPACEKSRPMSETLAAARQAEKEIEQAVGKEAAIGRYQDGSKVEITVQLLGATAEEATAAEPKVNPIISKHFPEATKLEVKPAE